MWWPAVVKSEFPLRLDYGRSPHAYVNQRLQIQLELLMMSGVPLETCWAFIERWNNKFYYKVAACRLFLLNHTTMHGSINIKWMLIVVNNNAKYFAALQQCKLYFLGNTEHSVHCRQATSTPTTIKKWKLLFAFSWQQWLRERATMSRCTYMVYLVIESYFDTRLANIVDLKLRNAIKIW